MIITQGIDHQKSVLRSKAAIEGPTRKQATKMAAHRAVLQSAAAAALARGDEATAFDLDCEAWDIEAQLSLYGFASLI